jgi:hypothetical protein
LPFVFRRSLAAVAHEFEHLHRRFVRRANRLNLQD